MNRGVLYIVWGDSIGKYLGRSMQSVRTVHPELPIHVERLSDNAQGLKAKTRMGRLTPFDSTLCLDADTVVLGPLDFAFERAEQFGLACCICEAPWMRRYGTQEGDAIEYNTGVLFFTQAARQTFNLWEQLSEHPHGHSSRWQIAGDVMTRGLQFDDQASFGRAVVASEMNPFVLPINYNLRPTFHRSFFAPVKIWHAYEDVPNRVRDISAACEQNLRPITYVCL